MKRSTRSASFASASRARSRRRSAAAFARSMSRCGSCSTCSSACGRCATSRACPRPVRQPELVDMVIFRENTEDIYAGIEYAGGTAESQKVLDFLAREFPKEAGKVRFGTKEKVDAWQKQLESIGAPQRDLPVEVGIGFKPISYLGTERLVHSAIGYAIQNKRKSVTLVHKGNIMKFTEGGFRDWGYRVAKRVLRRAGNRRRPVVPDPRRQAGRRAS